MKHFIRSLCGLTLLTSTGLAQPAVIRLTLGGGSATDLRGVRSGAYVIAPSATLFPHIVDGAGYSTQFVLFRPSPAQNPGGKLQFYSQSGQPMDLSLR